MAIANSVSSASGGAVGGPVGTLFCKNAGLTCKIKRIMHHAMIKEIMHQNSNVHYLQSSVNILGVTNELRWDKNKNLLLIMESRK